ncbi:MAG: hypothetical protein M3Q07_28990, partial [Pseudobdellovibrionaceae bacterium]|nr:hypothetical protein [Pseudobdellovibrionaceae bacterium]
MKKESSIERNLLFLSAGALTIFTVFLGSFFWVQSNLADNQTHNKGVVSPVHQSTEILNSSFNELFNRQNKIATTETSVGITGLGDRQRVETQIQDAKKGLTEVLPMITSMDPQRGDEAQKILQGLDQDLASFLDSDQRYYQANLKRRLQEETLAAANKKIESRLKGFLETTQGLSGKIRFTHGSSVRRAHRLVQSSGFNDEAKSLIQARILGSSNLKLSLVNEVLEAAGELNRLAARIAPASSEDQINTLIANELVQQREKAMVNIQDLRDEVRRDPELEKIASELQTSLVALTQDMMDNRNPESLVNLKLKVFAAIKEAAAIRSELESINATISTSLGQLVQTSEGLSRELDEGLS